MDIEEIKNLVNQDNSNHSIGTKKEKSIHKFLKYYISKDPKYHEYPIDKHLIDCFLNQTIYEIQTRSFRNLKDKLDLFLNDYSFCIVYPVYQNKMVYKLNELGEIISIRKSPKKENLFSIGKELYQIKTYLKHPNLHFKIFVLDVDEYKTTRISKRGFKRLTPIDKIIKNIIEVIDINNPLEWLNYISIDKPFTRGDFMNKYKISYKEASGLLNTFVYLDILKVVGKKNKAYLYETKK